MRERKPDDPELEEDEVFFRAVRSLAFNRSLLPAVEDRLDRAESIVRSRLLSSGGESIQAGPFGVSLDEDQNVKLEWHGGDDWQQLQLPDIDALMGDPLDTDDNDPL